MPRVDYRQEYEEKERNELYILWVRQRAETLRNKVSAHDVLRHFGADLRSEGRESILCPFHGDTSPSAKIYTAEGNSPSGVYCWVCRKRWDIFGLWREYMGDPQMKFTTVLFGLERAFGLETPEAPDRNWPHTPCGPTDEEKVVYDLLEVCEKRLLVAKPHFELKGYLTVGKLLDRLHYQMNSRLIDAEEAEKLARMILDKIGEKIRGAQAAPAQDL
jgi:hypothetical protein